MSHGMGVDRKRRSEPAKILAANLRAFLKAKGWSQNDFETESHGKMKQRELGRLVGPDDTKLPDGNCNLLTLETLAEITGAQPWQLLVKGLNWDTVKTLRPVDEKDIIEALQVQQQVTESLKKLSHAIPPKK